MTVIDQARIGLASALRHEWCDKCGTRMWLHGTGHGLERWRCPNCLQVIGIDRDPEVGGRFQLDRGQPWRYSQDAFRS